MKKGQPYTGDKNHILQARAYLREKGIRELLNPHAAIGRTCSCGGCFCCAAQAVVEAEKNRPGSSAALLDA